MSDTKALHDVVATALANWGNGEAQDAFEALMGRLRSAEADNAALYSALSLAISGAKGRGLGVAHWNQINEAAHAEHPGAALLEEVEGLRRRVEFLSEREQHIAKVLDVADGGQYRNDWDGAVARLKDAAHDAALEEAAKVADREAKEWADSFEKWRGSDSDAADRCSMRELIATDIANGIRALKTGQGA